MSDLHPSENRKLYKSRRNRKLAGVCGGIGEFFGIDPSLVRLGLVVLTLLGGSGVILYIIAAIILEDNPYQ
jgi:phage shock protein C